MFRIDTQSQVSLEDQIVSEIRHAIASGDVKEADPLPSGRQLGADLRVHWNTVARAYRRLRDNGLVSVGRGRGVFVRPLPTIRPPDDSPKYTRVLASIRQAVTEARLAGFTTEELNQLFAQETGQRKTNINSE